MTEPIPERLREWLTHAVRSGASDLHLIPGHPPVTRLHGELTEFPGPPLSEEEAGPLLLSLCSPAIAARLGTHKDADFAFDMPLDGRSQRFRANLFHAGGHLAACLRVIPGTIPDFGWANFPIDLA